MTTTIATAIIAGKILPADLAVDHGAIFPVVSVKFVRPAGPEQNTLPRRIYENSFDFDPYSVCWIERSCWGRAFGVDGALAAGAASEGAVPVDGSEGHPAHKATAQVRATVS